MLELLVDFVWFGAGGTRLFELGFMTSVQDSGRSELMQGVEGTGCVFIVLQHYNFGHGRGYCRPAPY